jgi:hypothetical protein
VNNNDDLEFGVGSPKPDDSSHRSSSQDNSDSEKSPLVVADVDSKAD